MSEKKLREDDFSIRRQHLSHLSDQELKDYFWQLAEKTVAPMIELAQTNTSPSIERSVLMRMGFSSIESKNIVEKVIDQGLIGKGAGHVVYRYATIKNIPIRDAGLFISMGTGFDEIKQSFKVTK